jgi:hypothetical protein
MFMDDKCLLPTGFESSLSNRRKAETDTEPALGCINTGASVSTSTSRPYSSTPDNEWSFQHICMRRSRLASIFPYDEPLNLTHLCKRTMDILMPDNLV